MSKPVVAGRASRRHSSLANVGANLQEINKKNKSPQKMKINQKGKSKGLLGSSPSPRETRRWAVTEVS